MSEPWLPAPVWSGDYPGTQAFGPVGHTVRKKRNAKRHQVEELAEGVITFDDVDLAGIQARPAKQRKPTSAAAEPPQQANAGHKDNDAAHPAGDRAAGERKKKKRKQAVEPAGEATQSAQDAKRAHAPNGTEQQDQGEQAGTREATTEKQTKGKRRKNKFKNAADMAVGGAGVGSDKEQHAQAQRSESDAQVAGPSSTVSGEGASAKSGRKRSKLTATAGNAAPGADKLAAVQASAVDGDASVLAVRAGTTDAAPDSAAGPPLKQAGAKKRRKSAPEPPAQVAAPASDPAAATLPVQIKKRARRKSASQARLPALADAPVPVAAADATGPAVDAPPVQVSAKKRRKSAAEPQEQPAAAVPAAALAAAQEAAPAAGAQQPQLSGKKRRKSAPEPRAHAAVAATAGAARPAGLQLGNRASQESGATVGSGARGSKLSQMRLQLQGGRFRMLNEKLYMSDGERAFVMMQANPELFDAYHEGFRAQTTGWDSNPVDIALQWLRSKPAGWVVADFGCGDAQLAQALGARNTVHSFDLVSRNERVTACNMANVPLADAACDAVVFSLALMGTDYPAFLAEARRVLKAQGFLWIAEVRSRFVPESAEAEDFKPFLAALKRLGFVLLKQSTANRMFVVWVLSKLLEAQDGPPPIEWPVLKPCIYKRR